jgi:signal peptidase II
MSSPRPSLLMPLLRDSAFRRYVTITIAACAVDLLTKEMAVRSLAKAGLFTLTERLSLTLVWNTGAAGGMSIGPFTWVLNVVVTVLALGLVMSVVRAMAAVDTRSTLALGLVSGGALGNLASIVAGPRGVLDFLAVRLTDNVTMVANVADLFLWSGALALIPVGATLVRMSREEKAARAMAVRAELA